MIFADQCIVATAFFLACLFRFETASAASLHSYLPLLPLLLVGWGIGLYAFGTYSSFRTKTVLDLAYFIFKASIAVFVLFTSFVYLADLRDLANGFLFPFFFFAVTLLIAEKSALKFFLGYIRKKGLNYRNILIVGTGKRAQHFIGSIHQHPEWGLKIVGLVDEDERKRGESIEGHRVIGSFVDIAEIFHTNVIDEVVFIVPRSWLNKIEDILYLCDTEGIKAHIATDYFDLKVSKLKLTELGSQPFLTFDATPDRVGLLLIKRLFDIVASGVALLLFWPALLILAVLIRATSRGPALFRQPRVGLNRRIFTLYKLRTMVADAEEKLTEVQSGNEMRGPAFKMSNDPRVTPIGRFLRKFSLDELPQLWNVFKGDMSLVGPRPPIPKEVKEYDTWQRRRLSMRPGITCLWQIGGRNRIADFNEWSKLDLEYIDHWSLLLDCKIFLKTIPAVLTGAGAK